MGKEDRVDRKTVTCHRLMADKLTVKQRIGTHRNQACRTYVSLLTKTQKLTSHQLLHFGRKKRRTLDSAWFLFTIVATACAIVKKPDAH